MDTKQSGAQKQAMNLREVLHVDQSQPLSGFIGEGGEFRLPGDKSISHRAALFAALAEGESEIQNFLDSGVTRAMLEALKLLGVHWELNHNQLKVSGRGLNGLSDPFSVVDCGNSATTMRLLVGAMAACGVTGVLDGTISLRRRPMMRIVEPLQQMGVPIEAINGCAPIKIQRPQFPLQAIQHRLQVASAQVKSCLLLAALSANGETTIYEPGPSRDHTERMLRTMGVNVSRVPVKPDNFESNRYPINGYVTRLIPKLHTPLRPLQMTVPGDISGAAFVIAAGVVVPGSSIDLQGVGLNTTRTGLIDVLLGMGADIRIDNIHESSGELLGDLCVNYKPLHGVEVSGDLVVRMIDEFPIFAVVAASANGQTVIRDASELRHKESDRIAVLCQELRKIGVDITEMSDGFIVKGGEPIQGGMVQAHGDHRLAMAFSIAGLISNQPVIVEGAEMIEESFPNFVPLMTSLGAPIIKKSQE